MLEHKSCLLLTASWWISFLVLLKILGLSLWKLCGLVWICVCSCSNAATESKGLLSQIAEVTATLSSHTAFMLN